MLTRKRTLTHKIEQLLMVKGDTHFYTCIPYVFRFSHFRIEYFIPEDEPCLCVYLSVRPGEYFHNFRPKLMKMHSNDLNKNLR